MSDSSANFGLGLLIVLLSVFVLVVVVQVIRRMKGSKWSRKQEDAASLGNDGLSPKVASEPGGGASPQSLKKKRVWPAIRIAIEIIGVIAFVWSIRDSLEFNSKLQTTNEVLVSLTETVNTLTTLLEKHAGVGAKESIANAKAQVQNAGSIVWINKQFLERRLLPIGSRR
jgi:hypothetical protein